LPPGAEVAWQAIEVGRNRHKVENSGMMVCGGREQAGRMFVVVPCHALKVTYRPRQALSQARCSEQVLSASSNILRPANLSPELRRYRRVREGGSAAQV